MIKLPNSYFWIVFLPAHLLFFYSIFQLEFNVYSFFLVLLFWTLISGYGIGVGYHRLLSHKSFITWDWIETVVSFLGCLGLQGSPIFWVNLHRGYHHPFSDTIQDVHSPVRGKLWAYLLWPIMVEYKSLKFDFVNDLFRKNAQLILHYMYFPVVLSVWAAVFMISPTIFYCLVIAQIISMHQEFCVNLFCHSGKGYRNFDLPDRSVNRYFFGLFFWGVGYHNNHHAQPNKYSFAFAENEFDPTVILISLIKKGPK